MIKLTGLLVVTLMLTGCLYSNLKVYSPIDITEKTMTVPTGSRHLIGALKKELNKNGWKLLVYGHGPIKTEGEFNKNVSLETYDTFNTRYNLLVEEDWTDYCLTFDSELNYDISLIDNKTGEEVITLSGLDCLRPIVRKFINAVEGN